MPMTSEEIASKEFLVGLRGYDKDEVRSFLKSVAGEFEAASAPPPAPPAEAAAPEPAPSAMADLGGQIEAILATANQEASKLRAEAEADAARIRSEADTYRQTTRDEADNYGETTRNEADAYASSTRADADAHAESTKATAEQTLSEADKRLAAAQDEALGLVADAQTRVDKMMESSKHEAEAAAALAVAHLTTQIGELTNARNSSRQHLTEVRAKLDKALAAAEADPDSTD